MKKWAVVTFIFTGITFLFYSCWNNISNPKKRGTPAYTAYQFLTAMQRLDFEEAASYGTDNTKTSIRLLRTIVNMLPEDKRTSVVQGKIKITRCELDKTNRQRAICYYTVNDTLKKGVPLVHEGGRWLVDFKKEQNLSPENFLKVKVDTSAKRKPHQWFKVDTLRKH